VCLTCTIEVDGSVYNLPAFCPKKHIKSYLSHGWHDVRRGYNPYELKIGFSRVQLELREKPILFSVTQ